MANNRAFLDALIAYQEAARTEHLNRATRPERTVDDYAADAIAELNKLIDERCKAHDLRRLSMGAA